VKIAIFGSWRKEDAPQWHWSGTEDIFRAACYNLGAEIAGAGHSIIVSSDRKQAADRYFVDGFIEKMKDRSSNYGQIYINESPLVPDPFLPERTRYPKICKLMPGSERTLQTTHLTSIEFADRVIVIGGSIASYIAGFSAILSNKRVVPIASFGGAAKKLLIHLNNRINAENRLDESAILNLNNPWTEEVVRETLRHFSVIDFPRILFIHGRSKDWEHIRDFLKTKIEHLQPLEMAEAPDEDLTLPQKWEKVASRAHGAIAIATADDVGSLAIDNAGKSIPEGDRNPRPRARENVWLEVGYLWGKLGRKRFRVLLKEDISIPTDVSGVIYLKYTGIPLDHSTMEQIEVFIQGLRD
jgi:hypothetical protein